MKNKNDNCSCINCGKSMEQGWAYCPHCRWQVEADRCGSCGQQIDKRWLFCPSCRNPVNRKNQEQKLFNDNNEWLNTVLKKIN